MDKSRVPVSMRHSWGRKETMTTGYDPGGVYAANKRRNGQRWSRTHTLPPKSRKHGSKAGRR